MKKSLVVLSVVSVAALGVTAGTCTWKGGSSGNWMSPENWDGGVPDAADAAVVFTNDANVTIDKGSAVDVRDITIGAGATVSLTGAAGSSLTVRNGVSESGCIVIGQDATCNLSVPIDSAVSRLDVNNRGAFNCYAPMSNSVGGSDYGIIFSGGTMTFGNGASVYAKTRVFFGNGKSDGNVFHITGNARIEAAVIQMAASAGCESVEILQDGVNSVVTCSTFDPNNNGTVNMTYTLKAGTLTASAGYTGKVGATGHASYVVDGGTLGIQTLYVAGGTIAYYGGSLNLPYYGRLSGGTDMTLLLGGAMPQLPSGATTLGLDFAPGATVTMASDHAMSFTLVDGAGMPADLTIGANATVKVPAGVQWAAETLDPVAVTVKDGGILRIDDQTGYVMQAMDLSLLNGGKISATTTGASYARTSFVCHSLSLDGTPVEQGTCLSMTSDTLKPYVETANDSSTVLLPHVWTGAMDNRWGEPSNWKDGNVPPSNYNVSIDLSAAAGRTIDLGSSSFAFGSMVFMPKDKSRKVTLSGTGAVSMWNALGYTCAFMIAEGATVVLDVNLTHNNTNPCSLLGNGTLEVLKGYPAGTPHLSLDGNLVFRGTTDLSSGNFAVWGHMDHHRFDVRFAEGVRFGANVINFGAAGFTMPECYAQDGGSVSAASMYVTACANTSGIGVPSYVMNNGDFTISDGIYLGTKRTDTTRQYPNGDFILEGGTVATPKFATELNSNYIRLRGGVARIGAGGFEKTETYSTNPETAKNFVANGEPGIQLGGATLCADTADWSIPSTLDVLLTGENGDTTFDLAHDVVISGAVSGPGCLVKKGVGTLTIAGAYSAGRTLKVEAGKVAFSGSIAGLDMIDLAAADSLSLPSGTDLEVDALVVAGTHYGKAASVTFGEGTVTVRGTPAYSWIGPNGGKWSVADNWYAGKVPNGDDVTLDFGDMTVPADGLMIEVDAAVSLSGIVGNGRIALVGAGVLTLADGGEIDLPAGAELDASAPVHLAKEASKKGEGKLIVDCLRSATDPDELLTAEDCVFAFRVAEGEVEVTGEVAGLRLFADGETAAKGALITIGENAILTNKVGLNLAWNAGARAGYGSIVQNGGAVEESPLFNSGTCNLSYTRGGDCSYTLNGGTLTFAASGSAMLNRWDNYGDVSDAPVSRTTITINDGVMTFPHEFYIGTTRRAQDKIVLNGGVLDHSLLTYGALSGAMDIVLNGGTLRSSGISSHVHHPYNYEGSNMERFRLVVDGNGTFDIVKDRTEYYEMPVVGAGTVVKAGAGRLSLGDVSADCDYDMRAGTLILTSDMLAAAEDNALLVGKGAKADLEFEGSADVGTLTLNGRMKSPKFYSSANKPAYLSGTGVLNVLDGPDPLGAAIIVR